MGFINPLSLSLREEFLNPNPEEELEEAEMARAEKKKRRLRRSGEGDERSSCCFPEEILREVCLRLPVKALLRFRSVDKRLLNLISTRQFATDHLDTFRPKEDKLFLLHQRWPTNTIGCSVYLDGVFPTHVEDIPTPYGALAGYGNAIVVDYCNGIACLICGHRPQRRRSRARGRPLYDVLFLNPSIRKSVAIPAPDLSILDIMFGFGLVDDDYKLIAIPYSCDRGAPLMANILSLKTRNWEKVTCSWSQLQPLYLHVTPSHLVFLNGACHWLTMESINDGGRYAVFVLSIHLGGDHVTDRFAFPSFSSNRSDSFSIHVYEGCLTLIVQRYDPPEMSELWVMKEYGDVTSWTRIIEGMDLRGVREVVGFTGGGDVVYSRSKPWGPEGFVDEELSCYNPTSKTTRSLKEDHRGGLFRNRLGAYKETLVLLNQN